MVHALGLGRFQVGRSHECDYPIEVLALPVCTAPRFDVSGDSREIDARVKSTLAEAESVYRVFEDVLRSLEPTHIITQTQCRVCAVSLEDVERALSDRFPTRPRVVALEPNSLDEILRDFLNIADGSLFDEQIITELFGAPPSDALLVFGVAEAERSAKSVVEAHR